MIMHEKENDVIVKGLGETAEFSIKTSAKAFKILSQSLYSNPVGAVVRELSTNAYDSHVMAGCPERPFQLKIPNSLDPEFSIRDYGTGLSHEDVLGLYSTFFESTKTTSNDVVGCLGLGSKSPFALTDSFFVVSYFNGVKSTYSVYTDSKFIPSISLFGSEETDEENGLEIQIAVKSDKIKDFPYEVKKQLHFFKTKPVVLGQTNFSFNNFEIHMQGNAWYFSKDFNTSYVVQGQIAYPLDRYLLREVDNIKSNFINTGNLVHRGYAFELPIGSVDIAPSREALSYDDETIKTIVEKAKEVVSDIEDKFVESINNAKNIWEAITIRYSFSDYIKYNPKFPEMKYDVSNQFVTVPYELKKYYLKSSRTVSNTKPEDNNGFYVNVKDEALFIRVKSDEHKGHDYKVRQHVMSTRRVVYVIYSDLTLKTIKKNMRNTDLEIIEVSSLDYKRVATVKKKERSECKRLTSYTYRKSASWSTTYTDYVTNDSFYVEVNRLDYVYNNSTFSPDSLINAVNYLRNKGVIPDNVNIYGLNKKQIKETEATNLIDHVKEWYSKQTKYELPFNPLEGIDVDRLGSLSIVEKLRALHALKKKNAMFDDYTFNDMRRNWDISYNVEKYEEDISDFNKYELLSRINSSAIPEVIKMMEFCEQNGFYEKEQNEVL